MRPRYTNRNTIYLLAACLFFLCAGIIVIVLGAISYANPTVTFAGLFKLEPFLHLVQDLV
jgi:hypothetical protein